MFLHETGHFVTARMTGMKATQFFLGFGPRLWSFRRGETEYGVRALPLGAFVRIIGMNNMDDVPPADEARTYRQASYPRRMLVISAGSLMHLLIAIVLLFAVYSIRGEFVDTPGAEVGAVQDERSGRRRRHPGRRRRPAHRRRRRRRPRGARRGRAGPPARRRRRRRPSSATASSRPSPSSLGANTDEASPLFGAALLGVSSRTPGEWQSMSLGDAATSSVTDLFPMAWENTKGVVQVLNPVNIVNHLSGATDDLATRPTTVVGVTQVSGTIGDAEGFIGVLFLLAALNVFVGVFNMFPLLPLDGGHAAIATYERVRERGGRRYFADVSRLMPFAMGVIVLLLALFMSGLYLDITQPLR